MSQKGIQDFAAGLVEREIEERIRSIEPLVIQAVRNEYPGAWPTASKAHNSYATVLTLVRGKTAEARRRRQAARKAAANNRGKGKWR